MLTLNDAIDIVKKTFPGCEIRSAVPFNDLYIIQAFRNAPFEEGFDPFFSVNKETGEIRDFSIITDGSPELYRVFEELERIKDGPG